MGLESETSTQSEMAILFAPFVGLERQMNRATAETAQFAPFVGLESCSRAFISITI